MKVAIHCDQCERKTDVEKELLKNPDKKRLRCLHCGAILNEEAIKETLLNSKQ